MKRIISSVLCAVLCLGMLTACGSKEDTSVTTQATTPVTTTPENTAPQDTVPGTYGDDSDRFCCRASGKVGKCSGHDIGYRSHRHCFEW